MSPALQRGEFGRWGVAALLPGVPNRDPWKRDPESPHLPVKFFMSLMQQSPAKSLVLLQDGLW